MIKTAIFILLICLALTVAACVVTAPMPQQEAPSSSPPPSSPPPPSSSTPQPLLVIPEVPQSTEQIMRRYTWGYGGKKWTWELQIPQSLYEYYKGIPRLPTANYSVYITHPGDDTFIDYLVSDIERKARKEDYGELEKVEFATAFVQSLPYTSDSITTPYDEYPRYPIETLVDKGGDCEDTSILLASLVSRMGYGVVLIIYPGKHSAIGVSGGDGMNGTYFQYSGANYYYIETTDTGWRVGEIPEEYQDMKALLYDMTPTSILTHEWEARGEGTTVELEVTVENWGTAKADEVYIYAGFDAGDDKLWNSQGSETFLLAVDQRITIRFTLQVPLEKHTRLVIQIIDDGYAVDESYSEWFDT